MDQRLLFVLHRAARAAVAYTNAVLAERLAISVAQLATLSLLAERPGRSLTEIARELDLNKSAVSGMLSRLERAELIAREPNPRDGRGAHLLLLDRGKNLRKRSQPIFRGVMAELTAGFTPAELDVVLRFLNAIIERCGTTASEEDSDE